jgi:hypothetical protein
MKNAFTFTASPSFAPLRLLAYDSSTPKSQLERLFPGSAPLLAPPAPGHYTVQPAKKTGQYYFYHLQIQSQDISSGSGQLETPCPPSGLHCFSWAGEF